MILDLLLLLFTAGLIMPITTIALNLLLKGVNTTIPLQDELNILQLRHILNVASDIEVEPNALHFVFKGEETQLSLVHNMLIRSPGTVIYLSELEEIYFEKTDNLINLCFKKIDETSACRILSPAS